jgi:hypothetical protein
MANTPKPIRKVKKWYHGTSKTVVDLWLVHGIDADRPYHRHHAFMAANADGILVCQPDYAGIYVTPNIKVAQRFGSIIISFRSCKLSGKDLIDPPHGVGFGCEGEQQQLLVKRIETRDIIIESYNI